MQHISVGPTSSLRNKVRPHPPGRELFVLLTAVPPIGEIKNTTRFGAGSKGCGTASSCVGRGYFQSTRFEGKEQKTVPVLALAKPFHSLAVTANPRIVLGSLSLSTSSLLQWGRASCTAPALDCVRPHLDSSWLWHVVGVGAPFLGLQLAEHRSHSIRWGRPENPSHPAGKPGHPTVPRCPEPR